ncbi:hypothetical protein WG66_000794 [Moniliophthora roreri]|nr:hypothetical protein WG66_000794 [Moniliophthora roreri]
MGRCEEKKHGNVANIATSENHENITPATPTPIDRQIVAQLLLDMEKHLKDNQSEINRLKSVILSLENKRKGLKRTMSICHSLLSPVHRIPAEVLAQIFTFCCEKNTLKPIFVNSGIARRRRRIWVDITPAVDLSRVCSRWREVTLSTPRLWSSIGVDFDENGWKGDGDRLMRMVQLFIARSKSSPLDLQVDFSHPDRDDIAPEFVPALQCLIDTCSRWSTLSLIYRQGTLENPIFHCIRGHLPILKHLAITGFVFDDDSDHAPLVDLFSDCPALESLLLQPGVIHRDKLNLPWHQIRKLSFYRTGWGPRFASLSMFPNVETLELLNSHGDEPVDEHF